MGGDYRQIITVMFFFINNLDYYYFYLSEKMGKD